MTAFQKQREPSRPVRSRLVIAAAAMTVAAAVAVVPGLLTSTSTPAYALTPNKDGSITFVINDVTDTEDATRALRRTGVRAVVLPAQRPGMCPATEQGVSDDSDRVPLSQAAVKLAEYRWWYQRNHPEMGAKAYIIHREKIPDGSVLVIVAARVRTPTGDVGLFVSAHLCHEPGPTCYELPFDPDRAAPTVTPSSSLTSKRPDVTPSPSPSR